MSIRVTSAIASRLARFVVLAVVIAGGAGLAHWFIYGSELAPSDSPLRGYVLLSAFTGGVALAFSRPFLVVLVPYLTILFNNLKKEPSAAFGRRVGWTPLVWYLGAFALVFTVTISGFPKPVATLIYRLEWLIDRAGGAIFFAWGLVVALGLISLPTRASSSIRGWIWGPGSAGILGTTTGLLMYHELDPAYDSVFFSTANAVAASHTPITVVLFTLALGFTYLGASSLLAAAIVSWARWAPRAHFWGRTLSGFATALIGAGILADQFGSIRALLF